VVRVFNHLKNPVVARLRTLKTEVMGFRAGKLVRVKTSSNKYQKTNFSGLKCTVGHTGTWLCNGSSAQGEKCLWLYRGDSVGVSALVELRIRRDSSGGVSKDSENVVDKPE